MIRFTAPQHPLGYLCSMYQQNAQNTKDLYYTADHEWIAFKGTVAYTGICSFKLTGFKEIHSVVFNEPDGFKKQGDVIATVQYNDYIIKAHMPVDGKIVRVNEALQTNNKNILLLHPETIGWIAHIIPSHPYERNGLVLPADYQMTRIRRYAR